MLSAAFLATAQKTPESMLGAALHQQEVQGDLKGAIAAYQKVLATPGVSRKTAAEALVQMGQCYEKLGDSESRKAYERVVREYADQKEAAAMARTRLGGAHVPVHSKGDRAVWTGPRVDLFGRVSPDGRFITYIDWSTGVLYMHDLGSDSDRPLTTIGTPPWSNGHAQFSSVSRDSKQVAYEWYTEKNLVEIRVVPVDGTGVPQPRRIFANDDISHIAPFDWSPDAKWLAVHLQRPNRSGQIGLVGIQDGSLRILKSVDWRGPSKMFFSPDGKYIAYDLPTDETNQHRNVFVMATDGSRETAAVAHPSNNIVMGWSPDGKFLLFSSDRTGSAAIWALAFADGKPQGAPEQVKPDGSTWSLGLTDSGALHVIKGVGNKEIRVAALDVATGKIAADPVGPMPMYIASRGWPDWSPDGKHLSYVSCGGHGGGPCKIFIRSMETGEVREVPPKLWYLAFPRWSPDGRSFITSARDNKGREGIYQIDAGNGDATLVVAGPPPWLGAGPAWSPDGKKIYYGSNQQILERDLASGSERVVFTSRVHLRWGALSPDGRYVAVSADSSSKSQSVLLVPVAGGEPRELLRVDSPDHLPGFPFPWTPDSQAVIVTKLIGEGQELWLVPIAGGQPRKLNADLGKWVGSSVFSLNPDGRQIAFVAGKAASEVWALENFLPRPASKR